MNVLALDLGTTTGWAAGSKASHISGVWKLQPGRFDSTAMRLVKFVNALNEIHAAMPISAVYYEEIRMHRGVDAAHWYGAFWGHLIHWCDERGIPHEGVPYGQIKKHWTGKGNANKEAMLAEAEKRGYVVASDDEADALALFDLKAGVAIPVLKKAEAA